MKVVVTQTAYDDLAQIGRAIANDDPLRAESFVAALFERCRRLAATPRAFPLLPGWEDRGIRRRPFGDYLIFYRVEANEVEILRVLHGARDYEKLLFPEE